MGPAERARRVLVSLAQCIQPAGTGANSTDIIKIDGNTYWYLKGMNPGRQISVGHDWQADGKMMCQTLVDIARNEHLIPNPSVIAKLNKNPAALLEEANVTPVDGGTAGKNPELVHVDCEWSINPLTWFLCPMLDATQAVIGAVDGWIRALLTLNVDYFNTDNNEAAKNYYAAWSSFRDIALSLLVIIGLIMVISQALSFGPFDAYTVKKVMPRIIIAVIFITLSWPLMRLAIGFSNVLGESVRAIIYFPFRTMNNPTIDGATITAGLIGGVGLGTVLGILGMLSFAATAALALLVALGTILLRQVIVTLLVIIAPIAIICYILPNTQRVWKMWSENFIKVLLVFPIISAFIAIGSVFAKVIVTDKTNPGSLNQLLAFIAVFAPFFMLPFAFRLAGGAMASINGAINNSANGLRGGLQKYRAGERTKNFGKLKTGDRFSNKNRLTRGFNKVSQGIGGGGLSGGFGLTKKGKGNIEMARAGAQAERMRQPGVQDLMFDDDVRLALMKGSPQAAKDALKAKGKTDEQISSIIGAAKSVGFDSTSRLAAMNFEAPNKSRNFVDEYQKDAAGNFVRDAEGNKIVTRTGNQVMQDTVKEVAKATGMDEERLLQSYMYNAGTQGGRLDLRDKSIDSVIEKRFDPRLMQQSTGTAWESIGNRNIELLRSGTDKQKYRAGAQLLAMQEALPGANEDARAAFTTLMSQHVDYSSGVPMEEQLAKLSGLRGLNQGEVAQVFRATSSTYGQATPEAQRNAGAETPTPPPGTTT